MVVFPKNEVSVAPLQEVCGIWSLAGRRVLPSQECGQSEWEGQPDHCEACLDVPPSLLGPQCRGALHRWEPLAPPSNSPVSPALPALVCMYRFGLLPLLPDVSLDQLLFIYLFLKSHCVSSYWCKVTTALPITVEMSASHLSKRKLLKSSQFFVCLFWASSLCQWDNFYLIMVRRYFCMSCG